MKILAVINLQIQTNWLGCIRVLIPYIFYFIFHKKSIYLSPQHSTASMQRKREHLVIMCVCESLSRVRLSVTPWTIAHQAPLSMEFSRQ